MVGIGEAAAASTLTVRLAELYKKLTGGNKTPNDFHELSIGMMQAVAEATSADRHIVTLEKRVSELEDEVKRLHDWNAEAQQYLTKEIAAGIFAMVRQDDQSALKSTLKLCCNCFADRKKSILQYAQIPMGRLDSLTCSRCKAVVQFRGWKGEPPPPDYKPALA